MPGYPHLVMPSVSTNLYALVVFLVALCLVDCGVAQPPIIAVIYPAPASPRHSQVLAAVAQARIDNNSYFDLLPIPLNGSADANMDELRLNYLSGPTLAATSAALILDGVIGSDSVVDFVSVVRVSIILIRKVILDQNNLRLFCELPQFPNSLGLFPQPTRYSACNLLQESGIPVLTTSVRFSFDGYAPAAINSYAPGTYVSAALDLIQYYNWNSTIALYSTSYAEEYEVFQSAAVQRGIAVAENYLADAQFPDSLQKVIFALDRSPTRITTILGSYLDCQSILLRLKDVNTQVLWIDPKLQSPTHTMLAIQSLATVVGYKVPNGFFHFAPPQLSTHLSTLLTALNNSLVGAVYTDDIIAAYDIATLWSAAVAQVEGQSQDYTDSALVKAAFHNLASLPASLVAPPFNFHHTTGERVGSLDLINWQIFGDTTRLLTVGSWVGGDSSQLTVNTSVVQFTDGTNTIPPSVTSASLTLGLLFSANSMNRFDPLFNLAFASVNNDSSIISGTAVRYVFEEDGSTQSNAIQATIRLVDRGVVGIIGPTSSSLAQAVQLYIGGLNIPTISSSATSDTLSDKRLYPTFYRTVIADKYQGAAMAQFVKYYNWSKACVVHYRDEYASNSACFNYTSALADPTLVAVADTFSNTAGLLGITVTRSSFASDATDYSETWNAIKTSNCTAIVAVPSNSQMRTFLVQATHDEQELFAQPNITWLFPDANVRSLRANVSAKGSDGLNHTINYEGCFGFSPSLSTPNNPNYDALLAAYRNYVGLPNAELPSFGSFLYDAIILSARALGEMVRLGLNPATQRDAFLGFLKNTTFQGTSGFIKLDSNGDRIGGSYGIYNFQTRANHTSIHVGDVTDDVVTFLSDPIFSDGTTTPPRDPTTPITSLTYLMGTAILIIVSLVIVVVAGSGILLVKNYKNRLIRRSSPFFLLLILLGLVLALASVYFWIGPPEVAFCHLRIWLGFIGCAIAYGSLLAKNARLYYLFNEPSLRVIAITNRQLLSYLAIFLSPLLIVLVLWSSLSPFTVELQLTPDRSKFFQICQSSNDVLFAAISFSYIGLLFVIGGVLSFKTRTLPDTFRESLYIGMATYNLLIVSALCIAIAYILAYDVIASSVIICAGLIIGGLVTWALIFIPKLYALKYRQLEIDEWSNTKSKSPATTRAYDSIHMSTITPKSSSKKTSTKASSKAASSSKHKASSEKAAEPTLPEQHSASSSNVVSEDKGSDSSNNSDE